jgi:hypothetical protein
MGARLIPQATATDISLAARGTSLYALWRHSKDFVDIYGEEIFFNTISLPNWADWPTANWQQQLLYPLSFRTNLGPWLADDENSPLTLVARSGYTVWWLTYDGNAWSAATEIPNSNTSNAPTAAYYGGRLIVAWRGLDPDQQIYLSVHSPLPPVHHHRVNPVPMPNASSSAGPALAVFNGLLYLCWKGEGNDQRIFYSTYDGSNWSQPQVVPGANTNNEPTLRALNKSGELYLCWIEAVAPSLSYSIFRQGPDSRVFVWDQPAQVTGAITNARPALGSCGGAMYVAWTGNPAAASDIFWGLLNALT